MVVSAAALTGALCGIVGSERLLTDRGALERYAVDGLVPRWVALPSGVEELSGLLRLASEEQLAVVPRGGGRRMGLGNLPARMDLVIDLSRFSELLQYEPDDLTVTVQSGMTLGSLAARLATRRQFLPLDPPMGTRRTVGGMIATNDSGPLRLRYGTVRDLLLGVRFIQADGTVTWGGAKVVKSVTGYDIPKLVVGSLGTLGVLAELTLRLHPIPEAEEHWLISFPSVERAGELLASVLRSSLQPGRLELFNSEALAELGLVSAPAAVAVTVGSVVEAVKSQITALEDIAQRGGAERCTPMGPGFWRELGRLRLTAGGVLLKVVTLPALVADRLSLISRLAASLGLTACVVAEAGNGVLRSRLEGSLSPGEWEERVIVPLRERVAPEGGSVVVEAAPRALKERLDVWGPIDPGALAIMKRLKAEFDPRGILNPGRFVARL